MKLFKRRNKVHINEHYEALPVPIVATAGIAADRVAEGRMVPLIILDTTNRPDIEELMRVHQHLPAGDVKTQWLRLVDRSGTVVLSLSFENPALVTILVQFDVEKFGALVEQIVETKLLYLQGGRPGDRFVTTENAPKVIAEITATGFRPHWDKLLLQEMTKIMRKKGFNRKDGRKAAADAIEKMRKFTAFRLD